MKCLILGAFSFYCSMSFAQTTSKIEFVSEGDPQQSVECRVTFNLTDGQTKSLPSYLTAVNFDLTTCAGIHCTPRDGFHAESDYRCGNKVYIRILDKKKWETFKAFKAKYNQGLTNQNSPAVVVGLNSDTPAKNRFN